MLTRRDRFVPVYVCVCVCVWSVTCYRLVVWVGDLCVWVAVYVRARSATLGELYSLLFVYPASCLFSFFIRRSPLQIDEPSS